VGDAEAGKPERLCTPTFSYAVGGHRQRRGALHLPARRSRQNVKLFLREP
jgi:hypothetical protein